MDINCGLIVGGVAIFLTALGYGYKIHADRRHIKLEKQDKEQHKHNEERIVELEKKNGHEQHQLDEHKQEITELKKDKGELKDMVIKLQERIINCEKNGHAKKEALKPGGIPTPPPAPKTNNPTKKGSWQEVHDQIKKRRKDLGEEEN